MRKSCLIQLIVLLLIGVVLSLSIKRWLDTREARRQPQVAVQSEAESGESGNRLIARLATLISRGEPGPTLPPSPPSARGIEGLALETSRPLLVEGFRVRGLVVNAQHILLAGDRAEMEGALLYQLSADSGTITQARRIDRDGYLTLGGMSSADGLIWLALNAAPEIESCLILGLEADTLETRYGIEVPQRLRIVAAEAASPEGVPNRILGIAEHAEAIYTWDSLGNPLSTHTLATGATYWDAELIDGRLVCAGTDPQGGVIDVLDPATMSLIVRHRAEAQSSEGLPLTSGGFGYREDTFYFALSSDRWPQLYAYRLSDGDLAAFIPGD